MYYYIDCLQKRGKFGLLWMAAFECTDFNKRSIQFMVKRCDIERSCDDILKYTIEGRENSPKMNLYVTSNLMAGLVKILKEKAVFTLRDSAHLFMNWGAISRSLSLRDVKIRRLAVEEDPEELAASSYSIYLHQHHHSESAVTLYKTDAPKKRSEKQRSSQIQQQQPRIINGNELAEMLRSADDVAEHHLVPQDITMREIPPVIDNIPDQGFGGVGLEDLAPFVREALGEVIPEIEQSSRMDIPIAPEVTESAVIPAPVEENDVPVASTTQPEPQIPTIEIQQPRDSSEVDIEQVVAEMLAAELPAPEREEVVREEPQRRTRDTNLEFSLDKIKERCSNFQNLMRHLDPRKDAIKFPEHKIATPEWTTPDELKILSHLLPPFDWPPARPKYTIEIAILQERISQVRGVEDESMEVQQIRDGEQMEDISMRLGSCFGSPTPTAAPREGRVRATPSPSPIGKGVQRLSAEFNLGDVLEPIPETAVIDASALLQTSMKQAPEFQAQGIDKEQDILVEETGPSPPKRSRGDVDSEAKPSSEESTVILENFEDKMKSLIAEVLKRKETVTFHDIAPPRTTSKRNAARLFSTLLDLEKQRVLVTQQEEAYGPIAIHLVQPAT